MAKPKDIAEILSLFRDELCEHSPAALISRWITEPIPYIFNDDLTAYIQWKHELGQGLNVDPAAICLVGSAAFGFSISPTKKFKKIKPESDIDVALVSDFHFDIAWRWMRDLGSNRYSLPGRAQASIEDHRKRLIYFGTIATDQILAHLPFGAEWSQVLSDMSGKAPANGRAVNARIYRDFNALRSYHADNFRNLKREELSGRAE